MAIDSIYLLKAINKTAALVVGEGMHYTPYVISQNNDNEFYLKTKNIQKSAMNNHTFVDLTGYRVGRLTVIGLSADFDKKWVLRCDCGIYTTRKTKAIKNEKNAHDMCDTCRKFYRMKSHDHWLRYGKNIDINKL
jgi:hypothetical protein